MSRLSKQRAKEKFLKEIEGVSTTSVFEDMKNNTDGLDLYTYFITKDAFCSGMIEEKEINEFLLRVYSDWYFLHKNTPNKNPKAVKILNDFEFAPVNLTGSKCFDLIHNNKYSDVLPVFFQYINRLEEKYFICVRTDELYNRDFRGIDYSARLYINLPQDQLLEFAKEFLDKAYAEEFPALVKVLNNDYRFDTITIYTDYEYVSKIIEAIESIKYESSSIFSRVGGVNPLLANVNDYIGFGEQGDFGSTYIASRCKALSSIHECAGLQMLKGGIVAEEQKIIFRKDGVGYTPTEYLKFLIERNALKLVENKILELEAKEEPNKDRIDRLYALRENIGSGVDLQNEVEKLKSSFTRKGEYVLKIDGVGEDNYNYLNKMYRLFTTEDERLLRYAGDLDRKRKINSKLYSLSETFGGVNTKEFLDIYFKSELSIVLKNFIDSEMTSIKRYKQGGVLANIKKKSIARLQSILRSILDDGDEGRAYIQDCIYDYVRLLAAGSMDNVEVVVDGKTISIEKDVNSDILEMLPELKQKVENLSISMEFIDKTLEEFGINKDNLSVASNTKNIAKEKKRESESEYRYYYNPDGYLSQTA